MIKTGEVIQINDAANDGMQSLTVFGATRQNLWRQVSKTQNGITITANSNGSITLSGTSTSSTLIDFTRSYALRPGSTYVLDVDRPLSTEDNAGGFYIQSQKADGSRTTIAYPNGTTVSPVVFTVPVDTVSCYFGIQVLNDQTVSGTYRIMLNEGSEAEPWCPPGLNGVEELSIVTTGKNIVSVGEASSLNFQLIDYFLPAGTYTLSVLNKPEGTAFNLRAPRALGIGTADDNVVSAAKDTVTFTLEYASPIFFNGYGSSLTTPLQLQLELGSTATAYEPPSVTTTTIDLDGHSLNALPDGTRDELSINEAGEVTLTQRVGVYVADGDEGWELLSSDTAPYRMFVKDWDTNALNKLLRPDMFLSTVLPASGTNDYDKGSYVIVNGRYQLYAGRTGITTADDFSSWLETSPMTILYPLATPQEVELPYVSMTKLKKRTPTVIFAASTVPAEMELDYRRWRQGADGFRVGRRHSFWTEGQCIASSNSGAPEKKSSTKTVPYMSGFYDFSAVYGAVAFESRELQYRFEMVGEDMADLQEQKSALLNWFASIQDQDIYDDTVPGRHYRGSFDSADWEEGDEGESGALDVTFLCQPFLIDDDYTTAQCPVGTTTVTNGGEAVNPTAVPSDGTATVKINGAAQQISAETRLSIQLAPGDNEVEVSGSDVTLKWLRATL